MTDNKILIATKNNLSTGDALEYFAKVRALENYWIHKDVNSLSEMIEELYYKQNKNIIEKSLMQFIETEDRFKGYIPTDVESYTVILAALVKACELLGESGWFAPDGKEMFAEDWIIKLINDVKKEGK